MEEDNQIEDDRNEMEEKQTNENKLTEIQKTPIIQKILNNLPQGIELKNTKSKPVNYH